MVNCLGTRRCGGMVDTRDLKSLGRKTVPVRVGSPAPKAGHPFRGVPLFVLSVTTRTGGSILNFSKSITYKKRQVEKVHKYWRKSKQAKQF